MLQAVRLQVVALWVEKAGIRVPPQEVPTVLGPAWFELDTAPALRGTSYSLSADDREVLLWCFSQTLIGQLWPDYTSPSEQLAFIARLQDAAAARGWEIVLPASAGVLPPPRAPSGFAERTTEILAWYECASGIVLREADLEQLRAVSATVRSLEWHYDFYGHSPSSAALRAESLAFWLLNKLWPETTGWCDNVAFVTELQAAARSQGLQILPERWRWDVVKAFQEAMRE